MARVKVSDDYRVEIPEEVREYLDIKPGVELEFLHINGRVDIIRIRHPRELRGFLKGADIRIERDEEDRV